MNPVSGVREPEAEPGFFIIKEYSNIQIYEY
jgi:hypothetical protein